MKGQAEDKIIKLLEMKHQLKNSELDSLLQQRIKIYLKSRIEQKLPL